MTKQLNLLIEFHKAYDVYYNEIPGIPPSEITNLRDTLHYEEYKEVKTELEHGNLPEVAKELCDLLYVVYGTIISYGLQDRIEDIFDEVHRSNMSKLGEDGKPLRREDGKILKGPNYFKADTAKFFSSE